MTATTPQQPDWLDQAMQPFVEAVESDDPINEISDSLVREEWRKFKAAILARIAAERAAERKDRDKYWRDRIADALTTNTPIEGEGHANP